MHVEILQLQINLLLSIKILEGMKISRENKPKNPVLFINFDRDVIEE